MDMTHEYPDLIVNLILFHTEIREGAPPQSRSLTTAAGFPPATLGRMTSAQRQK